MGFEPLDFEDEPKDSFEPLDLEDDVQPIQQEQKPRLQALPQPEITPTGDEEKDRFLQQVITSKQTPEPIVSPVSPLPQQQFSQLAQQASSQQELEPIELLKDDKLATKHFKDIEKNEDESKAKRLLKSYGGGLLGTVTGAGSFLEAQSKLPPPPRLTGGTQTLIKFGMRDLSGVVGPLINKLTKPLVDKLRIENPTFVESLSSGAGSLTSFFIPGMGITKGLPVLGASAKISAVVGTGVAAILESAIEGGAVYEQAVAAGSTPEEAAKKAQKIYFANIPVNFILDNYLFGKLKSGKFLKNVFKGVAPEAAQEGVQQLMSNVALDQPALDGVVESMAIGGILGGGVGGGRAIIQKGGEAIAKRTGEEVISPGEEEGIGQEEDTGVRVRDDAEVGVEAEAGITPSEEEEGVAPIQEEIEDEKDFSLGMQRKIVSIEDLIQAMQEYETEEEAFTAIAKIKDIPAELAEEFTEKYNPNKDKSPKEAFSVFYKEAKSVAVKEPGFEELTELEPTVKDEEFDFGEAPEKIESKGLDIKEPGFEELTFDLEEEIKPEDKPLGPKSQALEVPITEELTIKLDKEERTKIRTSFQAKSQSQLETKQSIIKYAKENLDLKDRGKLLSTVKNAKTERDLNNAIDMMDRMSEKTRRTQLREEIRKELRTTKPKKVSGKPKGKFTPEIQISLDILRSATKRSRGAAQEKLAANLSVENPTPEMARENAILNMVANSDTMSAFELEEALKDITSLKETGRLISEKDQENFREDIEKKKKEIVDVLEGTVGKEKEAIDPFGPVEAVTRKDGEKILKNKLKSVGKSLVGWNDVLDMLSFNDKTSKAFQSQLNKIGKISGIETAEKKGNRIALEQISNIAKDVYNIESDRKMAKKFIEDSKISLKIGKLELTKAQSRKRWMEFQDASLDETFANMGYAPEIKQKITESLSKEDKDFARAQLEFYNKYYAATNEVYKKINGVNLPQVENYNPIRREDFGKEKDAGDFLNEVRHRSSIAPGSVKSRTANKLPLAQSSDIEVLAKHVNDMEHYKAWAFKIRELNALFNNPEIRSTIKRQYGQNTMGIVDGFIEDFTRGRIDSSKNFNVIDKLRVNFTTSVLGLKPALAIKQLVSIPAYAENIPTTAFVKNLVKFFANPISNTRTLMESEVLKARGENLTRDMRDAMNTKEYSAFRKKPSFKNSLMLFTKMGDKGAIIAGGWTNYKYARDQGKSHEEAIKFFEDQTSQAQQSADLSQLSSWQRSSSFTKLFTMFTSSQNQYFRRELAAIRNLLAGRTTKKQAAKTIAIYHFILPMLFQYVASGFKWEDKDQLRAMVVGSLNGVFILKDVLDSIVRTLQKDKVFGFGLPLWDSVEEFNKSLRKIDWDDIEMEDIIDATKRLATAGGLVAGYGAKELINKYEGAKDFFDDDKTGGVMRMLGWSKYAINKQRKEKITGRE